MLSSKIRAAQIRFERMRIDAELRARLEEIESFLHQQDPAEGAPVLFFNASTRISRLSQNAGFSLIASYALRAVGIEVRYLVCEQGLSQCMLGSDPHHLDSDPPCQKCMKLSSQIYPLDLTIPLRLAPEFASDISSALDGQDFQSLKDWSYKGFPLGALCLPTLHWVMRSTEIEELAGVKSLFIRYLASAANLVDRMLAIIAENQPGSIVVFNGITYPEAVVREVAMNQGVSVITHEVGLRPLSAFFSHDQATFRALEIPDHFTLSAEENQRLDAYLDDRFKGKFTMAGVKFWPDIKGLPQELSELFAQFGQAVSVFSNVIFDTSQVHANEIFADMFDWLDDLEGQIRANPETLFVLRAHPDEDRAGKQSRQSVEQWVRSRSLDALENFVFISPSDYVNSYEIMARSKFVLVYNSSIGLEASLMGLPVLAAGRARYSLVEAVEAPAKREDYSGKLAGWLAADQIEQNENYRENARKFLYFELYRGSLDFSSYLIPDKTLAGFVSLSHFDPEQLLEDPNGVLSVLRNGILNGTPFNDTSLDLNAIHNAS